MKIQVEVELTDEQVEFLKNLVLSSENEFTYDKLDYDMYHDLVNKGIVVEWECNYGESGQFLSQIGQQIKTIIN